MAQNKLMRRYLGFKQGLNDKLMSLTYFKFFGWAALGTTTGICILIVLFKDNYFFHNGILTDMYNLTLRKTISIVSNSNIKTIYSEVYKTEILFDEKYIDKTIGMFFMDLILLFLKILGYFFVSFFMITKFSNKKIDESVKDIYEDKVISGSEVLLNGKYIDKAKELRQYYPDDGIFITCVYERTILDEKQIKEYENKGGKK